MAYDSRSPPIIPDGQISRVRFETLAFFRRPSQVWRGLNAGPYTPPPFWFAPMIVGGDTVGEARIARIDLRVIGAVLVDRPAEPLDLPGCEGRDIGATIRLRGGCQIPRGKIRRFSARLQL